MNRILSKLISILGTGCAGLESGRIPRAPFAHFEYELRCAERGLSVGRDPALTIHLPAQPNTRAHSRPK
jgi:hypothetical protein